MARTTPSYRDLTPASETASRVHSRSSKKSDTKCEQVLRSHLFRLGLRFRKDVKSLPGRPDIVFPGPKVLVFCDGDFWHGKNWEQRKAKLTKGTNPKYWVKKIETNMARDDRRNAELESMGWTVLRFWESDILAAPEVIAAEVDTIIKRDKDSNNHRG